MKEKISVEFSKEEFDKIMQYMNCGNFETVQEAVIDAITKEIIMKKVSNEYDSMAYIVSRTLENKIAMAEKNDQNEMSVTLDVLKIILSLLKEHGAKTGHWIESAGYDKCSVCGTTYSDLYPDYQCTHYCPNCGAKMIV